jgi:hypothetical protein
VDAFDPRSYFSDPDHARVEMAPVAQAPVPVRPVKFPSDSAESAPPAGNPPEV